MRHVTPRGRPDQLTRRSVRFMITTTPFGRSNPLPAATQSSGSSTMTGPRRPRRLFASAAAVALAVTGVALAAPSAEAAPAPRTYTAVMTPATATPGVSTAYSVVVKNTSTKISALDRFSLMIPSGFTVTPGSAATSRAGWTGLVTANRGQGVHEQAPEVRPAQGPVLTVTFNATYQRSAAPPRSPGCRRPTERSSTRGSTRAAPHHSDTDPGRQPLRGHLRHSRRERPRRRPGHRRRAVRRGRQVPV